MPIKRYFILRQNFCQNKYVKNSPTSHHEGAWVRGGIAPTHS
jgi:hypothetical protein